MRPGIAIGICGKIGSGKDEVAKRLAMRWGFRTVPFADELKEEVLRILRKTLVEIWLMYHEHSFSSLVGCSGPTDRDLRKMLWEDKPPIVRRLLQEWGTELRRHECPTYWIDKWSTKVAALQEKGISVSAPDTRFHNEYFAVKAAHGYLIRVIRPGTVSGDHASELELDHIPDSDFDVILLNTGTISELYDAVDRFVLEHRFMMSAE